MIFRWISGPIKSSRSSEVTNIALLAVSVDDSNKPIVVHFRRTTHYDFSSFERGKFCFDDDVSKSNHAPLHKLAQSAASRIRTHTVTHWYDEICDKAIKNRDVGLLHWLRGMDHPDEKTACSRAANNGALKTLKWARAHGCPWDKETCASAAWNGHLDALMWLRANDCPWDASTCSHAAWNGHFEVLKWARANGCPWDEDTCSGAANSNRLDILKWACANGCPWNENTCENAAQSDHLELLQWARANGCPWDSKTCRAATYASWFGFETLQWVFDNGCPWDFSICVNAAANGHLDLLKWACANDCLGDIDVLSETAVAHEEEEIVQFLAEVRLFEYVCGMSDDEMDEE
jgi:hypothetical protein